jgi:hypothetical protein
MIPVFFIIHLNDTCFSLNFSSIEAVGSTAAGKAARLVGGLGTGGGAAAKGLIKKGSDLSGGKSSTGSSGRKISAQQAKQGTPSVKVYTYLLKKIMKRYAF